MSSAQSGGPPPLTWESGLEIKPVYGPAELEQSGGSEAIGQPGEFPFTRGIHPHMYRARPFTMRQYSGFGTAKET
ncbi:MAG: methylmalonyl-CoA mutase family protein, partial [Planctomycetota bacterium]|nr:methylmalonyl-CoA mutase family protein [Planctomycetota bacterium]